MARKVEYDYDFVIYSSSKVTEQKLHIPASVQFLFCATRSNWLCIQPQIVEDRSI